MRKRNYRASWVTLFFVLLVPCSYAQTSGKKKVSSQADLPRFTYPLKGPASELVQADDAAFNAFASKVRTDLDSIFRDYDIADKATMRSLLHAKINLQYLAGDYQGALGTIELLRAQEEKPSAKLLSGIIDRAILQAATETKSTSGAAFEESFKKHAREAINSLPWDIVQNEIRHTYVGTRVYTKALAIGEIKTDFDPAVQTSGALDNLDAWQVIATRNDLHFFIPLEPVLGSVLKAYIAAHNVVKPDIWAVREVTLTKDLNLTPVLVAIWDSGIDVSLFPDQLFTDPHPTASGTHGLAFDDVGGHSTSWLYPLTPEQQKAIRNSASRSKGSWTSRVARTRPRQIRCRKNSARYPLTKSISFSNWKRSSPSIFTERIVPASPCAVILPRGSSSRASTISCRISLFPPTEEWVHHLRAAFQQMSDYFKTRDVRVVNMSWGDDVPEFETWLSRTGGGADPAERKKRAAQLFALWRDAIQSAIQSSPNTLFIAAAGNSDSNAGFNEAAPASLHLPNLISVGAVNQAGDETSFTSYGDTVLVDADGYWVESFVPGGTRLKLSGTSMATPMWSIWRLNSLPSTLL